VAAKRLPKAARAIFGSENGCIKTGQPVLDF
jgi:hypothetical protein